MPSRAECAVRPLQRLLVLALLAGCVPTTLAAATPTAPPEAALTIAQVQAAKDAVSADPDLGTGSLTAHEAVPCAPLHFCKEERLSIPFVLRPRTKGYAFLLAQWRRPADNQRIQNKKG